MRRWDRKEIGSGRVLGVAVAAGLLVAAMAPRPSHAQDFDDATIDLGIRVYKANAVCQLCHGWTGTGGIPGDEGAAGPPLTETQLGYDDIVEVVRCGRPVSGMPRHSRKAWTADEPCYGMVEADVGDGLPPGPEHNWLREEQIKAVAAWIVTAYKGKEMTLQTCERFFDAGARQCNDWR